MALADDLKTLVAAVNDRRLATRWNYYAGEHPKIYVTPKMRVTFKALADSFDENYCGLAVNARLSRLQVTGWGGRDADAAQEVWDRSRLARRQSRLWRYALVHSNVALIADVEEGEGRAGRLLINPATVAYGHPDPDDPDALLWMGKVWQSTDGYRATIMYPDEIVRLVSGSKRASDLGAFRVDEGGGRNPLGVVPGVVLAPYDEAQPLIDSISGLQNRINKIASNKFVAAEFGAFRQRVFFTTQSLSPYDVKNQPDEAIILDPGEQGAQARVQELTATDLANYDKAKDAEVDALFTLAALPRHMRVNPGTPPSGEAIKADEGPFVECIKDLQNTLGEGLVDAMALLDIDAEPVWRDPTVHNELVQAQTVQTFVDAGVPVDPLLTRYADWSQDEVEKARASAPPVTTADTVGAALLGAFNAPGVPTADTAP